MTVLLALGLGRVPTEALMYRAFLPRLDLWRGTSAYLSSNFAAQVMPPPSPSIVQYGYFRGGGHPSEAAGLAAVGSFVFPTIGRLLVAPVALALLVFTGETNAALLLIGAVSLLVSVAVGPAGFWFLRREETARHLGAKLQRPLSSILVRLRREPVQDAEQRAVAIRERTLAVLRGGCRLGSIGVAANLLLTYVILLVALRSVDVSAHDLPAADAFAAFAVAFWAGAVIPITGSGLGVVDTVMIAALIELSDGPDDPLVAAVLIWRTFYSFLTLPLGAITLSRFRKGEPRRPQVCNEPDGARHHHRSGQLTGTAIPLLPSPDRSGRPGPRVDRRKPPDRVPTH